MKLLWILPYSPTSIRTRAFYLLQNLLARGHAITLATVWESDEEHASLERWALQGVRVVSEHLGKLRVSINMVESLLRGQPLQSRYSWSPRLARRVESLLLNEDFDGIHVEHLRGAEYGLLARRVLKGRGKTKQVVWDSVDCISQLFEAASHHSRSMFSRWVAFFELSSTRRYERGLLEAFRTILVTSENDKIGFEKLAGQHLSHVDVLPNGVDAEYFFPEDSAKAHRTIVFSGKLSYHANVAAALQLVQEVMPFVWAEKPDTRVILAGKDPRRVLVRLGQIDRRIVVTGTVEDLRPYLRQATVAAALVPYGTGIQNKVLEAMACGTAVVGSPQAALALQVTPGKEMMVAEGAAAQARLLLLLMEDAKLRAQIAEAGREYIIRQHNWQVISQQLEQIYSVNYGKQRTR